MLGQRRIAPELRQPGAAPWHSGGCCHDWFVRSVAGEEPYRDYYVWADPGGWQGDSPLPPSNWLSKVRTSAWTWRPERGQFYYHQYQPAQPDLNFRDRSVINWGIE